MDLHDVWYYEFVGGGREFALDVDSNQAAGGPLTLFINHRVEDYRGYLLGVAGVGLNLEEFARIIQGFQSKYHRRITLVDEFGTVQLGPDAARMGKDNIRTMPGISAVAARCWPCAASRPTSNTSGPRAPCCWPRGIWTTSAGPCGGAGRGLGPGRGAGQPGAHPVVGVAAWAVILALSVVTVNYFHARLVHMAATDQLTGAANRWEFEGRFGLAVSRHARHGEPFSLILFDLDHFKAVNDCLGHLEGGGVLQGVAALIRGIIRPSDLLARWGGDEFMVLAEGGLAEGLAMAERIRQAVAGASFTGQAECRAVTVSCGVAEYQPGETLDSLTRRADQGAYAAKEHGRDRVEACSG
jgi:diguanylate cyclase (GGDEF)-like protein